LRVCGKLSVASGEGLLVARDGMSVCGQAAIGQPTRCRVVRVLFFFLLFTGKQERPLDRIFCHERCNKAQLVNPTRPQHAGVLFFSPVVYN
jgi:hypothetical protein